MDFIVGDYALGLVVVRASGVEVAVEAGKIAAADLYPQLVSRGEVVAGLHGLERDFVNLAFVHPHGRLVISFAVADTLDIFFDIVGGAVGQHFDELHGDGGVLKVARYVQGDIDGATNLDAFLEGAGAVNQDVVARFQAALVERAGLELGANAAEASAMRGNGIHGVVYELVRAVFRLGRG